MSGLTQAIDEQAVAAQAMELRIRFAAQLRDGDIALVAFNDPAPCYAIASKTERTHAADGDDFLDVVLQQPTTEPQQQTITPDPQTIFIKYRGIEVTWRPGRATLQCDSGQTDSLLPALAEFAHYESALRNIETEIAAGWTELEQDKALAFEVTPADLACSEITGARMRQAFGRRIRYARIEPHLYEAEVTLSAAGQKLGAELREKARIESRLETVDAQIEVYEHVYEMSSQRLGEYRASREEHTLEWIIIVLLAAEFFALLAQMVWSIKHR